jgi:hypothetical protein
MIYILDALRGDPDFSFSVSSARAIPFGKLLKEVVTDDLRAKPVKWGSEQKGMSPGGEVSSDVAEMAESVWKEAARSAAAYADMMAGLGVHKSIVNRIIEPYIHVHCLMTGVEAGWMNFFGLRLDKAADPTLQALAEECWKVWNESTPQKVSHGGWHVPFYDPDQDAEALFLMNHGLPAYQAILRVSAARCARLSYQSFETGKRSTIEEDLNLFNRLVGGPVLHASPCEHQCTPDTKIWVSGDRKDADDGGFVWEHPELHGNLKGWVQHRKLLSGEAIAPLPEGYASNV